MNNNMRHYDLKSMLLKLQHTFFNIKVEFIFIAQSYELANLVPKPADEQLKLLQDLFTWPITKERPSSTLVQLKTSKAIFEREMATNNLLVGSHNKMSVHLHSCQDIDVRSIVQMFPGRKIRIIHANPGSLLSCSLNPKAKKFCFAADRKYDHQKEDRKETKSWLRL